MDRRDFLRPFEQVVATLKVRPVVVGREHLGFGERGLAACTGRGGTAPDVRLLTDLPAQ